MSSDPRKSGQRLYQVAGKVVKPRRGLFIRHRERYIGLVKKAEANDMVDSLSHEAFTGCLIFGHDEHPRTSRVWLC